MNNVRWENFGYVNTKIMRDFETICIAFSSISEILPSALIRIKTWPNLPFIFNVNFSTGAPIPTTSPAATSVPPASLTRLAPGSFLISGSATGPFPLPRLAPGLLLIPGPAHRPFPVPGLTPGPFPVFGPAAGPFPVPGATPLSGRAACGSVAGSLPHISGAPGVAVSGASFPGARALPVSRLGAVMSTAACGGGATIA